MGRGRESGGAVADLKIKYEKVRHDLSLEQRAKRPGPKVAAGVFWATPAFRDMFAESIFLQPKPPTLRRVVDPGRS